MISQILSHPVWLTLSQRERLERAAVKAKTVPGSNPELCDEVLRALLRSDHRDAGLAQIIRATVRGLRLPLDIAPVFLCEREAEQLIRYGGLALPLTKVISCWRVDSPKS